MRIEIRQLLQRGAHINIIGDSLAAGAGSSGSWKTDKVILCDGEENFMRRIAPNSWWGSFETYLKDKFPGCTLENNGCGGASSGQLRNGIEQLFCEDRDDIIFLFFGANDRKRENGMQERRDNLSWMIRFFREKGKEMVVFTPTPSTVMNEAYVNRLYHMEDVANIIIDVAEKEGVILADNYNYIMEYLLFSGKKIDEILFGCGCSNDGCHPADAAQLLIYRNLLKTLGLSPKIDGAVWR